MTTSSPQFTMTQEFRDQGYSTGPISVDVVIEQSQQQTAPLWAVLHLPQWLVGLIWFRKRKR